MVACLCNRNGSGDLSGTGSDLCFLSYFRGGIHDPFHMELSTFLLTSGLYAGTYLLATVAGETADEKDEYPKNLWIWRRRMRGIRRQSGNGDGSFFRCRFVM